MILRVIKKAFRPTTGLAVLVVVVLLVTVAYSLRGQFASQSQPYVYYTASRSDLPIVVTERGNLESQVETEIRCEVENMSYDRSSTPGTQIIFIVPNGSAVKKDDLLVELDSAVIRDRLDQQVLSYERAKSQKIQAVARFENQKTQNETLEAQAQLRVDLARLQLEKYTDEKNGDFALSKEEIERQVDDAKNKILEAQAALELEKTEKLGIEALFKLGYRGKSDLDQSRFRFLQAEDALASAVNRMSTYQASLKQLDVYEFKMQTLQFEGEEATALRNLKQVKTDSESLMAQAEAAKNEALESESKELERLEKLKTQLELCKIYAPHDGMVVYARERSRYGSSDTDIAEGATVRERQEILTLPDLSKMQVKTQIHEAVLDQIKPGLRVTVRIDAFPNQPYSGIVEEVAVVANRDWRSNVQTYDCVVRIVETVVRLKPGMTAVVDIHVDRIENVVAVPVQAVVQVQGDTWCYVASGDGVERRDVQLGRSNDKFVQIVNGLDEIDQVVLNPMAILESTQSESEPISPDSGAPEALHPPETEIAGEGPESTNAAVAAKAPGQGAQGQEGTRGQRPGKPGDRPRRDRKRDNAAARQAQVAEPNASQSETSPGGQ